MTEQEFLTIVSLHVETYYECDSDDDSITWWPPEDRCAGFIKRAGKALPEINLNDFVMVKWVTGGQEGGSWKSNSHYPIPAEREPPLEELDTILALVCPQITLQQYKCLLTGALPSLIEEGEIDVDEYYANSTAYRYKRVVLRRLFERLQGLGLL